jgi:hypothetical protein
VVPIPSVSSLYRIEFRRQLWSVEKPAFGISLIIFATVLLRIKALAYDTNTTSRFPQRTLIGASEARLHI